MTHRPDHEEVLRFWFDETPPARWWSADADFDALIARRFGALHLAATRCELFDWRRHAEGRLAEIVVLDQFSRNLHRGTPAAFAADPLALALAQEAVAGSHDAQLTPVRRSFLYMPYMHSESAAVHRVAARLFASPGLAESLESELRHKAVVDRFGRYPHRNAVLGRTSTEEELRFLAQPGSRF